jgi:amidase
MSAHPEPNWLTASEGLEAIGAGRLTAPAWTESCLARIAAREAVVGAWTYIDPPAALARARSAAAGKLHGLPVGVKDIIDTADAPTGYGSPIYRDHQPARDAAIVARLRALGAVILGKTVTTEFATFQPGKTANPHNPEHTPGGSSSGSAAAVADGMVPIALGTQTAGSVIRPAAFCGVVGFKGSHGELDTAGVKLLAPSLDTLGFYARSVADIALLWAALLDQPEPPPRSTPPRIGVIEPPSRPPATPAMEAAITACGDRLRDAGAALVPVTLAFDWQAMTDAQNIIMCAEMVRGYEYERTHHRAQFSAAFEERIVYGETIVPAQEAAAQALAAGARQAMAALFAGYDALLMPAALGEAPKGLAATGDPVMQRAWTLLGLPCLALPAGLGPAGLPLGAQLIGARGKDAALLATGGWIEARLGGGRA